MRNVDQCKPEEGTAEVIEDRFLEAKACTGTHVILHLGNDRLFLLTRLDNSAWLKCDLVIMPRVVEILH